MFDGRIYRAAFAPLLVVLVIAGFSLASPPAGLRSTLAPDAFDGSRAFAGLQTLARRFPDRRPGSAGDDALAAYVSNTLRGLGGPSNPAPPGGSSNPAGVGGSSTPAGGGFQVRVRRLHAQTIDGARTLTTVIAERPGSTGMSPIAILAHRDAVQSGSAADLSGTAALLELARVFSQGETRRTIVLVSTSGGSGGDAGAADFAAHGTHALDATIVLGDLAGVVARKPFVLPFSADPGAASERLERTLESAISQEVGADPGAPGAPARLVHLAFPLVTGEEAPLNSAGVPSVLVQVSGERGPSSGESVSQTRLQSFGRAVLSATYALDEGLDIPQRLAPRLPVGRKALPGWAMRLLVLALMLPPLLVGVDALARLRRRHEPVLRWVAWTLAGGFPLLTCALFAVMLGALGIVAAPAGQPPTGSLSADGSAPAALASVVLVLVLALLAWPALVRRLGLPLRPSADGAGVAVMLVLLAVALLAWVFDPFACLLAVPALHLWLLAVEAGRHAGSRARALAYAAIIAGVLPLGLLLLFYARELGLGPGGLSEGVVLALAGGRLGLFGVLIWSIALGCVPAVALLVPSRHPSSGDGPGEWADIYTRGPLSYAGPGSLGGTESALRR